MRVPPDLHKAIHEAARKGERTFNAEIISRLAQSFEGDSTDAGVRLALKTLADTIQALGEEAETMAQVIEAMAAITERAASYVSDEAVKLDVQRAANLARVLTNADTRRSFNVVQEELLKLAKGADPDAPAPDGRNRASGERDLGR